VIWIDRFFILAIVVASLGEIYGAPVWRQILGTLFFFGIWQGSVYLYQGKIQIQVKSRGLRIWWRDRL